MHILTPVLASIILSAMWTVYRVYTGWVAIMNVEECIKTEAWLRARFKNPDLSLVWSDIVIEFLGVALILFVITVPLWLLINVLIRKSKRSVSE